MTNNFEAQKAAQKQALQDVHARMALALARCSGYVDAESSSG